MDVHNPIIARFAREDAKRARNKAFFKAFGGALLMIAVIYTAINLATLIWVAMGQEAEYHRFLNWPLKLLFGK